MCMVYAEFLIFIREQIFLYHTRFMDGSVRHTSLSLPAERWESDTCIPLLHLKDVGMSLFEINFHYLYWLCPCINKNICLISIINSLIKNFGFDLLQVSVGYFLADLGMILWLYPLLGGMEYVSVCTRTPGSQALILHVYYNFFL